MRRTRRNYGYMGREEEMEEKVEVREEEKLDSLFASFSVPQVLVPPVPYLSD